MELVGGCELVGHGRLSTVQKYIGLYIDLETGKPVVVEIVYRALAE